MNDFSILSPKNKLSFYHCFEKGINLIVGEKDSGKSTLVRSILYTLGCDVRDFDMISYYPENIYILNINIDFDNYIIIRKKLKDGRGKNYFKVIINKNEVNYFYDTKSFSVFLNAKFKINIVTLDKNKKETKLYPNHIFLPFYVDQDNSWQNYLTSTFTGINFIDNYRKLILEYFTGIRSNKYYKFQLQKTKLKSDISELDALILSKKLIIEENNSYVSIIEDIDIEEFKKQYKYFLKVYKKIVDNEHLIKEKLNENIYKRNSIKAMKNQIETSLNKIIYDKVLNECPNCHQRIYNTLEDNYKLYLTEENLIKEKEKLIHLLNDVDEEVNLSLSELKEVGNKSRDLSNKLNADSKTIELAERAKSYALNRVNSKLIEDLDKLRIKRDEKQEKLDGVEASLRNLNKRDLSKVYNSKMIADFELLAIPFVYKSYYNTNLEAVKISLSGATKVQAFLVQYLTIYEMILNCKETINIPIFIDTFLKDDFNNEEIDRTTKYIFSNLESKFQSFIFIANNNLTLNALKDFKFKRFNLDNKRKLLKYDYETTFERYADYLRIE